MNDLVGGLNDGCYAPCVGRKEMRLQGNLKETDRLQDLA